MRTSTPPGPKSQTLQNGFRWRKIGCLNPKSLLGLMDQVKIAQVDHILMDELVVKPIGHDLGRQDILIRPLLLGRRKIVAQPPAKPNGLSAG